MTKDKINKQGNTKANDQVKELLVIAFLVTSYIVRVPVLTLAAFVVACCLVLFSGYEKALYYLAFFTSFSGIFVYNGKHMFFVMAALVILKSLISNRIKRSTFLFYLAICIYSMLFCDYQRGFSFAQMIGIILLFVIPVVANSSGMIDCRVFIQHYIFGFVIATFIGFFAKSIPSMYQLFEIDLMWTGNYQEITRFFGLAFDSNFYALSNYILIAYLLYGFDKIDLFRGGLVLFLLITGIMTISKSYFLIACVLIVLYVVKSAPKLRHMIAFAVVAVLGIGIFEAVSNALGYDALDLITSRFVKGGGFADNTTGRVEIWKSYINLFNTSGVKKALFGFGFNARVVHAAHNTFIEFVYYYGLAGLLLWGAYFSHCLDLFRENMVSFEHKTPMVCICLVAGVSFLSAYTYEAFWIGIVIGMMTLGKKKNGKGGNYVQHNSANI